MIEITTPFGYLADGPVSSRDGASLVTVKPDEVGQQPPDSFR
jgi:hypothetical protein